MLIAEDLLLLVYDDEAGKPAGMISNLEYSLSGALLVELALRERVDVTTEADEGEPGRMVVRDGAPTGSAPLDDALERLAGLEGCKPKDVLGPLAKGDLTTRLLDGLAERGILRKEQGRVLGLFPTTRWPAEDSRHEDEVRAQLRRVLHEGVEPDERTAALIALLAITTALKHVLDTGDKDAARTAQRRAKEIAEGNWAGDALRKAVEEIVTATLLVPTVLAAGNP
ncbi:GPP34 family phosphoprotein [Saccharomonospora piscinae]|uniref:GPP34 family phosphoprotein n=1 Tax=Saccharomonospora piscinae TaxID=687388 RepID=A0A1V8ZXS3_SACPI|nr:GPP34 family phosphoprotein [Saccharomonospora piscinae]OQO89484.1 GPP34 family phosphoprotein [Saccharomonospora piscinae]